MGWDIVAIGTNHNLPVKEPVETAERVGYKLEFIHFKDAENGMSRLAPGVASPCSDACRERVSSKDANSGAAATSRTATASVRLTKCKKICGLRNYC